MILVVEDYPDTRLALLRLLAAAGYEGVPAGCGRDALTFLKDNLPRLVLLDWGLPDIDGLAVFRALRSDRRLDETRVLMFSAFDGTKRDEAMAAGVDGYVVKTSWDWLRLLGEIRRFAGPPTKPPANKRPGDAAAGLAPAA